MRMLGDRVPHDLPVITVDDGAGHPVVFLHGLGSDSSAWNRIAPELRQNFRLLLVDLPGVSLAKVNETGTYSVRALAEAVHRAVTAKTISNYSLVGHSFGGSVAMVCAHLHPSAVSSISVIAPGGLGPELNPMLYLLASHTGVGLLRVAHTRPLQRRIDLAADYYRASENYADRVDEVLMKYRRLAEPSARRYFRRSVHAALESKRTSDFASLESARFDVPAQVIWGSRDMVVPHWQATAAAARLGADDVNFVEGAGHAPHRTDPDKVIDCLSTFLTEGRRVRAA